MATAVMAAGTAMQAVGAIHQGNANAAISEYNANVANNSAAIVQQQGAEQERLARISASKQIGMMTASYGASGVTGDGSAEDVIRNSAANAELNALTLKSNTDIKATALKNEASLDYYRANNDRVSGYFNAFAGALGGGGKIAMMSKTGGSSDSSSDLSSESDMWAGEDQI